MTVDAWTLVVAIATLIVSILAYRYARRSSKKSQEQITALQEQLKTFFDSYNERIIAEEKKKKENADFMVKAMKEESKRMNAMFNSYVI